MECINQWCERMHFFFPKFSDQHCEINMNITIKNSILASNGVLFESKTEIWDSFSNKLQLLTCNRWTLQEVVREYLYRQKLIVRWYLYEAIVKQYMISFLRCFTHKNWVGYELMMVDSNGAIKSQSRKWKKVSRHDYHNFSQYYIHHDVPE